MASLSIDKDGNRRILFVDIDGERKAIWLGKVREKAAKTFLAWVERILEAREIRTAIDPDTARWVSELPARAHAKLVKVGIVPPREKPEAVTLESLLKRFNDTATVKDSTRAAYKQSFDALRTHLGADTPITDITNADADEWHKALAESGLAAATVGKRVRVARAVFRRAMRWGLIASNPFADLRAGPQSNPERSFYVSRDTIDKVLNACPSADWRAIVALSRFAGLRCPSEIRALRWSDVNWELRRMSVRSPKTAAHEGHAERLVPIAPELEPILSALFANATPGVEAVVPRLHDPKINLRTQLGKIIKRAGVKSWPRLFHNLRASCATDWVERFPNHVAAGWLGHSPLVAATHYLQTRDAHFDLAAGLSNQPTDPGAQTGADSDARPAQNAAQQPPASDRKGSGEESKEPSFAGVSRADASGCENAAKMSNGPGWIRTSALRIMSSLLYR